MTTTSKHDRQAHLAKINTLECSLITNIPYLHSYISIFYKGVCLVTLSGRLDISMGEYFPRAVY